MNKFNKFLKEILYPNRIWFYIGTILIVFWNYIVRELSKILLPITSSIPDDNWCIAIIFLVFPILFAFLHKEDQIKERHLFSSIYIPEFFFICIYLALKLSNEFTFYSYSFIEYIGSGLIVLILVELIVLAYKVYQINKNKFNAKPILEASPFFIDAPTIEDNYDRKKYAKLLIEKIIATKKEKNPEHSFVINIGENYGYGKTSFFLFLIEELKSMTHQSIYFNYKPWLCDSANAIITEFFQTLRNELNPYVTNLDRKINKYTKSLIQDYTRQTGISTINSLFHTSQTLKEEHDEIANAIKKIDLPIIIFIDDVDRLQNDELMVLLKLIRDTADFGNIFYILAADKPFLINSLNSLGIEYPEEYLKKFINYEFTFPSNDSITTTLLKNEISTILNSYLPIELAKKESQSINELIQLNNPFNNFRDVKRFLNNYTYMLDAIKMNRGKINIDYTDLFALTLIQYLQPELYKVLRDYDERILSISNKRFILKDEYTDVCQNKETLRIIAQIKNEKEEKPISTCKNIKDIITDSNISDELITMNLLRFLFGDKHNYKGVNRICQVDAYFSYFSAELKNNQISQNEVQEILDLDDLTSFEVRIEDVIKSDKIQSFIHKAKYIAERFQKNKVDLINKMFIFIEKYIETNRASYLSKTLQEETLFKNFELETIIYYLFNKEHNQLSENELSKLNDLVINHHNINLCAIFLNRLSGYYPHPLVFDYENIKKWRTILVERFYSNYITSNNPLELSTETLDMIPNLKGHYINGPWDIKFLDYINNLPNYIDWFTPLINVNGETFEWNNTYMKQLGWDMRSNIDDFIKSCKHTKDDNRLKDLYNLTNHIDFSDLDLEEHPFLKYIKNKNIP